VVDDDDLVGEVIGLLEVLGCEQDGRAVGGESADHLPDIEAAARVETRRGLVEIQKAGPPDEARGEIEPAPHASRVGPDRLACRRGETERLQQLGRPSSRRARREADQPAQHVEVLGSRQESRPPRRTGR
jgi:hypothetical protein